MKTINFPSCLRILFAAFLASAIPAQAQDMPDFGRIMEVVRLPGLLASIPIVIGAMFLIRIVENVGNGLAKRFSNRRPTIQKIQTVASFTIYIATFVLVIGLSIRLDPTAMAVIGGGLAFATGFALRDLVASFIAGITIMFDRPFQVGDRVSYGGQYGDIVKIGLRSVRMNTLDHNLITIPNNKVFTDVTSSGNYGRLEMQVPMEFLIGSDQDPRVAVDLIREACLASPYVFLENPVPILVRQELVGNHFAIALKARPYVYDCKYEKAFETDVYLRVLDAFRRRSIHPPAILHRNISTSPEENSSEHRPGASSSPSSSSQEPNEFGSANRT